MQSSVPLSRAGSMLDLLRTGIAGLGNLLRRQLWRRQQRRLRLCETLSLGNRGYLAVVRYREEQFLVGGTNSSISLLAQLRAPARCEEDFTEDDHAEP
jgi:flagellar biogenesis protein FliO